MGNNCELKLTDSIKNNWQVWLLFIFSFLLYANSITSNYNLDDELVTNGHPLTSQGIRAIPDIFKSYYFDDGQGITYGYRPVALSSFALENEFFGDNPFVSHLVNVILYSILVVLVYIFISRLFANKKYLTLAFAITLIFSSHPLHTEVIDSIKNREEILSLLFVILASITAIMFQDKGKNHFLMQAILYAVIAIFSKKSAIPGIVMIPAFLILFRPIEWKKLIPVIFAVLTILFITVPIKNIANNFLFISVLMAFYATLHWGKKGFELTNVRNPVTHLSVIVLGILFSYALITSSKSVFLVTIIGSLVFLTFQTHYRIPAHIFAFVSLVVLGRSFVFTEESKAFLLTGLIALSFFVKKDSEMSLKVLVILLALLISGVYIVNAPTIFNLVILALVSVAVATEFLDSPRLVSFSIAGIVAFLAIYTLIVRGFDVILFVYIYVAVTLIGKETNIQSKVIRFKWMIFPVFLSVIFISSEKYSKDWQWQDRQLSEKQIEAQKSVVRDIGRELEPSESVFIGDISTSEQLATSVFVLGQYLQLHIFPHPLRFYYGYAQVVKHDFREVQVWIWLLVYLSLFLSVLYFLNTHTIYSFGILIFLISLAPFSNLFIPMAGMIGERLAFSASLGFCIAFVYAVHNIPKVKTQKNGYFFGIIILLFFSIFGIKTIIRNKDWKDKFTLYNHDIQYSSESAKMNHLTGGLYFDLAREVGSADYYQKSVTYFEKATRIYTGYFMYWYSLGLANQYFGDYHSAIPGYTNALRLNSTFTDGYFNLAVCSEAIGDYQTAIFNYERYIELEPENENVYANLSFLYFQIGDLTNSITVNQNAIDRFPNNPNAYINLGKTYLIIGDTTNAVINLEKGALLDPRNKSLFNNLSNLFYKMNDLEKATYYQEMANN